MRKESNAGLIINILILIIAILIAVLFFMYYVGEQNSTASGFVTSDANIVISSIQGERIDEIENETAEENVAISHNNLQNLYLLLYH